jgi:hypothetical protein
MTELVREHDAGVKDGVAVVFVHGLEGDRHRSWTSGNAGNRGPWSTWLGQEAGCDTWTLSYDCGLSHWRDFAGNLHINGLSLMDKLATEPQLAGRPLILLAHDIGGLLVKKALAHALTKAAPRHRRMVGRIAAIVLIATPQSGAQLNTVAQAIALTHGIAPNGKDFSVDDAHLQELQREFSQLGEGLKAKIHVYAESKPVVIGRKWLGLFKTRRIAVPYDARIQHLTDEVLTTLAEDHFTICQPKDNAAPLHQSIVAVIEASKTFSVAANEPMAPQVSVAQAGLSPVSPKPQVQSQTQPVVEPIVDTAPLVSQLEQADVAPVDEKPAGTLHQTAAAKTITSRPALIAGAHDERLQPSESKLYGRDRELTRVLTFLENRDERAATVLPRAVDIGGTGKTELCKAALKLWAQRSALHTVFFVSLPDDAGQATFLEMLATGIGLDATDDADAIFAAMPPGLYYVDNLGHFALGNEGRQFIERLKNLPDVRLLFSSRYALPAELAQNIEIDALPKQSALNLFRDLWSGSDVLPVDTALAQFVDSDLQRHAMSAALLARLGVFFGYDEMHARWRALRVTFPGNNGWQTSVRLARQALSTKTGALAMWQAIAQAPQGVTAAELLQAEAAGLYPRGTVDFLQHHRIVDKVGDRFTMSTTIAQMGREVEVESTVN